jgi:hypothetical protein
LSWFGVELDDNKTYSIPANEKSHGSIHRPR